MIIQEKGGCRRLCGHFVLVHAETQKQIGEKFRGQWLCYCHQGCMGEILFFHMGMLTEQGIISCAAVQYTAGYLSGAKAEIYQGQVPEKFHVYAAKIAGRFRIEAGRQRIRRCHLFDSLRDAKYPDILHVLHPGSLKRIPFLGEEFDGRMLKGKITSGVNLPELHPGMRASCLMVEDRQGLDLVMIPEHMQK